MNFIGSRPQVNLIHIGSGIAQPGMSHFHSDENMLGLVLRSATYRQLVSCEHNAAQHQQGRIALHDFGMGMGKVDINHCWVTKEDGLLLRSSAWCPKLRGRVCKEVKGSEYERRAVDRRMVT